MRIELPFICPFCDVETFFDNEGYWYCQVCETSFDLGYNEFGEPINEESMSLEDAALIYGSNGCDEDYTYGYSEDELEDYLK